MRLGRLLTQLPAIDGLSSRGEHDPQVPASEREAIQGVWLDVQDIWHFVMGDRVVALARGRMLDHLAAVSGASPSQTAARMVASV